MFNLDYIPYSDIIDELTGKLKVIKKFNYDIIKSKTSDYSKRIILTSELLIKDGYL